MIKIIFKVRESYREGNSLLELNVDNNTVVSLSVQVGEGDRMPWDLDKTDEERFSLLVNESVETAEEFLEGFFDDPIYEDYKGLSFVEI